MSGIQEIARETGLSKSTVSRALRGLPNVTPATIVAVRRAADRLGYIASPAASGLATGRHHTIGVLVPVISRWFYISVLEGIDAELRKAGYDLVLFNLGGFAGSRERIFHLSILRKRIDALIVLCLVLDPEETEQLQSSNFPTIVVGGPAPGLRHLGIDDRAATVLATSHLLELGHRNIAHIGGEDESGINIAVPSERRQAFVETLQKNGLSLRADWIVNGRFSLEGGFDAMMQILQSPAPLPTAIFAASDEMALGAMAAIAKAGLRVPADISVIGIDGHEYGEVSGLTTVAQNPSRQGADAALVLLAELAGQAATASFPPAPFRLVIRTSTAAPPAAQTDTAAGARRSRG